MFGDFCRISRLWGRYEILLGMRVLGGVEVQNLWLRIVGVLWMK